MKFLVQVAELGLNPDLLMAKPLPGAGGGWRPGFGRSCWEGREQGNGPM